jgi:dTMP kinase
MFITFEGIDGSGKSTQVGMLQKALTGQGRQVEFFREPGGTELSEKVRNLLLNDDLKIHPVTELLLFSAARAQLISEKVKPALAQEKDVILDRFYDSTTAYQGYGRSSLPLGEIEELNKIASHNLTPDITFYLRIPLQEAQKRIQHSSKDRMERSDHEFYRSVIEGFEALVEFRERFIVIDGTASPAQIHQSILTKVKALLQ